MTFKQLLERAGSWVQHRHRTDELDEEIRLHLDLRIQRNLERGMTPTDARTRAIRQFGDPTRVREAAADIWISRWLDDAWQDLRFGSRWLKRSPGFSAVIVATLAVGIGVNTAMFSVINSVLLQPLPYPAPDRLIWIANSHPGCSDDCFNSRADFAIWAREAPSLESAAAYGNLDLALVADGRSTAERVAFVTPELWRLSGAIPRLGRLPNADERTALMISWGLFERQFSGNPGVVGKAVELDGRSFEIVGVLDRGFRFLFPQELYTGDEIRDIDAYAPLPNGIETPGDAMRATPQTGPVPAWVRVVARLRHEATIEQARAELTLIHDRLNRQYPGPFRKRKLVVLPLVDRIVGEARLALLVLLGAVSFVLVIACVNVANLLMARASARRKEIAIRAALGAGKHRVVRQFLTEAVLLGVLGGLAGMVLARLALFAIIHFGAQAVPRVADTVMDSNVLAFAVLVTLMTAVLFGLAPAGTVGRLNLEEVLREEGRAASSSGNQQRLRAALVSGEIALAMILVTGAGLMMRSFWRMNTYPPGFSPEKVIVMKLSLAGGKYGRNWPAQDTYLRQMLATIGGLPGVEAIGIDCGSFNQAVKVEGLDDSVLQPGAGAKLRAVSPGYLHALGATLTRGRWPSAHEKFDVVLVNQSLAFQIGGAAQDVVGKVINASLVRNPVVGVVADFKDQQLDLRPTPQVYIPYQKLPVIGSVRAVIRINVDASSLIPVTRERVSAIDPNVPVHRLQTLEQDLFDSLAPRRFNLYLLGAFAATALLLALVGIFGVISFIVTQRTREIGIRVALGARRPDIVWMVARHGMRIAVLGLGAGLAGALVLSRFMATMIYDLDTADPTTLLAVTALLSLSALLACCHPAYRATAVDPLIALRDD